MVSAWKFPAPRQQRCDKLFRLANVAIDDNLSGQRYTPPALEKPAGCVVNSGDSQRFMLLNMQSNFPDIESHC